MGFWDGPIIEHDIKDAAGKTKRGLVGVVQPKSAKALEGINDGTLDGVSAYIEFDYEDSKGNYYPEVITHVCATNYPVLTGQGGFLKLSLETDDGKIPNFVALVPKGLATKGGKMDPKNRKKNAQELARHGEVIASLAQILGVEIPEGDVEGLLSNDAGLQVLDAVVAKLKAAAPADGTPPADGAADETPPAQAASRVNTTPKDGDTKEVSALKLALAAQAKVVETQGQQLSTQGGQVNKLTLENIRGKVQAAVKLGRVPPALSSHFEKLLSLTDSSKLQALALSKDGDKVVSEALDMQKTVDAIIAGLPAVADSKQLAQMLAQKAVDSKGSGEKGVSAARRIQRRDAKTGAAVGAK